MEDFTFSLTDLGATGLLVIFVIAILRGMLLPRRTVDDLIKDRDHWREAHGTLEHVLTEQNKQIGQLLEYARTTDAILRSLPRVEDSG